MNSAGEGGSLSTIYDDYFLTNMLAK